MLVLSKMYPVMESCTTILQAHASVSVVQVR